MHRVFSFALLAALTACASAPAPPRSTGGRAVDAPASIAVPAITHPQGETAAWWFRAGAAAAHARRSGPPRARNIILFIGDGMSLPTVTAARIFEGQRQGWPGEENQLAFETFPHTALSKTYDTDSQTPDSAGTMTAMITGVKTRRGMLSVAPSAPRGDCAAGLAAPLATAIEIALSAGLGTGIVTTTRLTHATPGAAYGHSAERNWEVDAEMPDEARAAGCRDMAQQLVEFDVGDGLHVAMGGGRTNFLPAGAADPEYAQDSPGLRLDGRDLVGEWQRRHPEGRYVWNSAELAALDLSNTTRLLGLFEPDHMNYAHERARDRAGEPSLAEMTRTAITVLRKHDKGYFLIVEGGRIDHAHHAGNAYRALSETVAMSDAVRVADAMTSETDTLILVTADHSHTLSFVGYPQRGNPILGKVEGSATEDGGDGLARDRLGLPFTTLTYANGPGYPGPSNRQPQGPKTYPHTLASAEMSSGRPDLSHVDTAHPDYLQESLSPLSSESHGGDDVGVWARGPGAEAVRGSIEQNVIFHLLLQAQPEMLRHLCALDECEHGVPVRLPEGAALRARP